jgi:hypothetical protein
MYTLTATNFVGNHQDGRKMLNEFGGGEGGGVKFKDLTVLSPHFVHLRPFNLPNARINL